MKSMFDDPTEEKKPEAATPTTLNESIPYLSLGGVFTQSIKSLSEYVGVKDKLGLSKAIIDMFTLYPEVTDDMIKKLANNLSIPKEVLENEIYAILTSFFNKGKSRENPNAPIDPTELRTGIKEEMEHTDNPLISEKISRDHLVSDASYYSHLAAMEAQYQGKSNPPDDPDKKSKKKDEKKK
jgi:hypothetical protein